MIWIHVLLLLASAALACAPMIVAKKPDARQLLDKLVPFQAIIGVVLVAVSAIVLIQLGIPALKLLSLFPVTALSILGGCIAGILLGLVFGMPMISKATGKNGDEVVARLAPYQMLLGIVCGATGTLMLLDLLGLTRFI